MTESEIEGIVSKAVAQTLIQLGVDSADPLQMQKDFAHLRQSRIARESVSRKALLTVVGVMITGALGAIVLGIQDMLKAGS